MTSLVSQRQPVDFLCPEPELKRDCFQTLRELFAQIATSDRSHDDLTLPINCLCTNGFELDDIWEQIQLINDPLIHSLQKWSKYKMNQLVNEAKLAQQSTNEIAVASDKETAELEEPVAIATSSSSEQNDMEEDCDPEEAEPDLWDGDTEETGGDRFFDLSEMEEFVKQAEDNKAGSDGESIDLFTEDIGDDELFSGNEEKDDESAVDEKQSYQYYADFFDPVPSVETHEDDTELPLSSHQKRQEKMKAYIAKLEATNIEEKPWHMIGEVASKDRGENTLLEEDLLFREAARPAPEITEEFTVSLEDIIRQRINDKAWDDVIRKSKPKERPFNYKVLRPLNEEKSQLSLAEVYEQEYIQQTQEERKGQEENQKHKEIRELMKKLFNQLDALSNYHFTPETAEPEVKTIPLLPSITMEEVSPATQGDASLQAPEEIQAPSQNIPLGKTERNSTDRKRERRKKKKLQHLRETKRKKLTTTGKAGTAKGTSQAVKSSSRFFANLENEAKKSISKKERVTSSKSCDSNPLSTHLKL